MVGHENTITGHVHACTFEDGMGCQDHAYHAYLAINFFPIVHFVVIVFALLVSLGAFTVASGYWFPRLNFPIPIPNTYTAVYTLEWTACSMKSPLTLHETSHQQ